MPALKMKTIDIRKKRQVTLTFLLDEEVTPALFAQKIVRACSGGALRPGEGILEPLSGLIGVVTDETLSLPTFGHELRVVRAPALSSVVKKVQKRRKPR